jgi:hypothetical protein
MFENMDEKVLGAWKNKQNAEVPVSCLSSHIFKVMNSRTKRQLGHEGHMGVKINKCCTLIDKN